MGLVVLVGVAFIGFLVMERNADVAPGSDKVKVVASFYPLAHFAEKVGAERVTVKNLTPAGAEPHDFEPTPRDIVRLREADLILLNGAGFEPWFVSVSNVGMKDPVIMAEYMQLLPSVPKDDGESDDDNGPDDPHFWLDPVLAQKEVEVIRDALAQADPDGKEAYERNAAAFIKELAVTHSIFDKWLAACDLRTIIVPHNAFQYLGKRYNIDIVSISGISPDEEPSPRRLAELAEIAKSRGIKYIFFETLASPKLAETVAKEAGVETRVLNPIEGLTEDDLRAGENYNSLMRKNANVLENTMGCRSAYLGTS